MPQRAPGYQATTGFAADATLYDLDATTGYERTGPTSAIAGTVRWDFGNAVDVWYFRAKVKYRTIPSMALEMSDDDINWTVPTTNGWPDESLIIHPDSYILEFYHWTFASAKTHRYWRFSLLDDNASHTNTQIGLMEVWAEYSDHSVIPEPGAPQTITSTVVYSIPVVGLPLVYMLVTAPSLFAAPVVPAPVLAGPKTLSCPSVYCVAVMPTPLMLSSNTLAMESVLCQPVIPPLSMKNTPGNAVLGMEAVASRVVVPDANVGASGGLLIGFVRDMAGAAWVDETSVDTGADSGVGLYLETGYGAIYSRTTDADGRQVYWKSTANYLDWSVTRAQVLSTPAAAPTTPAAVKGMVIGAAVNRFGVICALIKDSATSTIMFSHDQGVTWYHRDMLTGMDDYNIVSEGEIFIIIGMSQGSPKHWISMDGGMTWL